jgi:hypothetical protein
VFEIAKEFSSEAKVYSCCASARGHVRSTAELSTRAGKRSGAREAFIMTLTLSIRVDLTFYLSRADPPDQKKDRQESSSSLSNSQKFRSSDLSRDNKSRH